MFKQNTFAMIIISLLLLVFTTVVLAQEDSADSPVLVVTDGSIVTLREGPASNAPIIKITVAEQLPIIGVSDDGDFYQVTHEGNTAWVSAGEGYVEGDLTLVGRVSVPCFVRTDEVRTVQVRVGFGTNRGVSTFRSLRYFTPDVFSVI